MRRALFLMLLPPSAAAEQGNGAISLDALIDAYYAYDFNEPPDRIRPFATEPPRHNEFNLNLAFVRARYSAEGLRASVALATGTYVEANYAAEPDLLKNIFEGYIGVKLGEYAWLDAGVLPSHIGFESAITPLNATYSRSLIADFSPFFETGARLTIEPAARFTAAVLVLNGWQNIRETNDANAVGLQLLYKPTPSLLLNYSNYLGDEAVDAGGAGDRERQLRFFNDFYVQILFSDRLTVTAALDIGRQEGPQAGEDATWYAAALVAALAPAPRWSVGARAEMFHDPDQAVIETGTSAGFEAVGASLNLDHRPADRVLLRLEGRLLVADDPVFPSADGLNDRNALITSSIAVTF